MKHREIIEQMTMEEKAAFLSGKTVWETRGFKRLNIPTLFCSDGPHGIRKQAGAGDHLGLNKSLPATCFPTAATIANSWNEKLGEEIGKALGIEASAQGVNVLLGPGLNIKRSPLCGRNFEYFSEDPYLAGKMAAAYVRGIQSEGIYACPKHFAVNSQELRRMAMNAIVDERTLREIYLTGFEIAVKEGGAKSIMTSYNEVNGVYANENKHLLKEILRDDWGFDGIVITDWGASNNHVQGVAAGSNLEMPAPGLESSRELLKAVQDGTLTMEELDTCVDDLLNAALELNKTNEGKKYTFSEQDHYQLAKKAASESAVLLKNKESILPLKVYSKIAVIGDFALEPRYQGSGSSMVNSTFVETIEKVIGNYELNIIGICKGYKRNNEDDAELRNQALECASKADIVIYCFGLNEQSETEGLDRKHMRIPQNQIQVLEALFQVNTNIVGILSSGASIEMPWHNYCKAILHGYLNGQAGASGIMDIVTGKINPSGRLNETYPLNYMDTPAYLNFPSEERNAEYRESIYVGYRYYDTNKVQVQYPFGFGLSYTTFLYTDLKVDRTGVEFILTNIGDYDGAEVVQLYTSLPLPQSKIFRPSKELKGFMKVFLKAKESKTVQILFDDKTFRYWNVKTNQWEIEDGEYLVQVGASVEDIRLKSEIRILGTTDVLPYQQVELSTYFSGLIQQVDRAEFEKLLGYPILQRNWNRELDINDAICQMCYAKNKLARYLYRLLTVMVEKSEKKGKPNLNILFIYNMPFRGLAKMTGGIISMNMVQGIVVIVNGHLCKGLKQIIGGFFSNSKANKEYEKNLAKNNE